MDELRIGDAQRERALASLGEHFALGRLTKEELDERSDAVWTARTGRDLAVLFADLPRPAPSGGPGRNVPVPRRRFPVPPVPVLFLVLALVILFKLPLLLLALGLWFVLGRRHWGAACGSRASRARAYSSGS